jgi:hypothetical protein
VTSFIGLPSARIGIVTAPGGGRARTVTKRQRPPRVLRGMTGSRSRPGSSPIGDDRFLVDPKPMPIVQYPTRPVLRTCCWVTVRHVWAGRGVSRVWVLLVRRGVARYVLGRSLVAAPVLEKRLASLPGIAAFSRRSATNAGIGTLQRSRQIVRIDPWKAQ